MSLAAALSDFHAAHGALHTATREALAEALLGTFTKNPNAKNIVFGVSTQPYNDENPGEGVFGPYVNYEFADGESFTYDDGHSLLYNGRYGDSSAPDVKDVFTQAGWEHVAAALDVGEHVYAQIFIAERADEQGNYKLDSINLDY